MKPDPARSKFKMRSLAFVFLFAGMAVPRVGNAKTLIDYFQPTPTACPVTTNTWGVTVPRDACNGLEDTKKPPQWIYWDGKVIKAADGKWHMLGSRWAGSAGHGGWGGSQAVHAVSDTSPLGPYKDMGLAYTNGPDSGDRSKGHNVAACTLPDGTYCLYVSETVPFTIFTSPSLDGPWTNKGHASIDNNGIQVSLSGDTHIESNVSLVVRPDGNFEIVQRHGIIALSTTGIMGPYKVQKPTLKYSAAETPAASLPSIYPNRQKHTSADTYAPKSVESTATYAEDPLIWYSGGLYHVVYDYPDDRVGYHLSSPDGIHDWEDRGFAYDPRMAKQLFSNTDGTVVSWTKMERPNVIMENGHITHFTFAVTDVDKGQVTGGSNHGNKVIVMAFDGASFDAEMGVSTDAGVSGSDAGKSDVSNADVGARGGSGGGDAKAGDTGGATGTGGAGSGGTTAASSGKGGNSGGTTSIGGSGGNTGKTSASSGGTGGSATTGSRGGSSGGASSSSAGSIGGMASSSSSSSNAAGSGGSSAAGGRSASASTGSSDGGGGCGCHLGASRTGENGRLLTLALFGLFSLIRKTKPHPKRKPLNPRPGSRSTAKTRLPTTPVVEQQTHGQSQLIHR